MPSRRLLLAYVASISLHAALLAGGMLCSHVPPEVTPAMIEATLHHPPMPAEPLLKDTLAEEAQSAASEPPTPKTTQTGVSRQSVVAARRKLAEHVYYPPEAIRLGLEGDVRLLLTLAADGTIVDASVAGSSGHAILDQAALRAAYALGRLPGMERKEIILPVSFRLRP